MKFEEALTEIGEFGRYQKLLYALVCLPTINCGIFTMISVFLLGNPTHRCAIPGYDNDTYEVQNHQHEVLINQTIPPSTDDDLKYNECHIFPQNASYYDNTSHPVGVSEHECERWVYETTDFEETVVSEFDLVCRNSVLQSVTKMIFFAGVLVGAFVFGMLSDRIGRKKTLYISFILILVSSTSLYWANSLEVYAMLRFLVGAACSGIFLTAYVIGMEMVGPSMRLWTGTLIHAFFTLGLVILAGIAYVLRDWRNLELAVAVPNVVYLTYYWLIPESPRWLLSKGRTEEAEEVLRMAARVNKVNLPEGKLLDDYEQNKDTGKVWHLFRSKALAIRTLVVFFNWMVISMMYYGLSLNADNLGNNVYLDFLLLSLVEIPACIMCILLFDRIGRKKLHLIFMLSGGVSCIATLFSTIFGGKVIDRQAMFTSPSFLEKADDLQALTVTLALIGKTGASGAFISIYIFAAELFPTTVRNVGIGASSCCARIGAMAAPYIADLNLIVEGDFGHALPLVIFGSASVVAGLMTCVLPETLHRPLPETIEDAENFSNVKVRFEKEYCVLRDTTVKNYKTLLEQDED